MARKSIFKLLFGAFFLIAVTPSLAGGNGCDEGFCINWWTIDSGGIIESQSADEQDEQWTLSGTIGQWDATEARALSGGQWRLTGGFWGLTLEELADFLFRDRFEQDSES